MKRVFFLAVKYKYKTKWNYLLFTLYVHINKLNVGKYDCLLYFISV